MADLTGTLRWSTVIVGLDPLRAVPSVRAGDGLPDTGARSEARYPGDVPIARGEGGQTRDGVILTSQVRTISLRRFRSSLIGVVEDPAVRRAVRSALGHHLGLDVPAIADCAPADTTQYSSTTDRSG